MRTYVRKRCTMEPGVRENTVVCARNGPSVFLPFRMRRFGPARCIHRVRCTAAVPGTKTPRRTITLNKSLPLIAIRCGSSSNCLRRCRCCLNKIKTTAATVSSVAIRNLSPGATPSSIIKNFKGDPIVSAGQMT